MRPLATVALIMFLGGSLSAQSFEVAETKQFFKGSVGEKITAQIPIRNLTNEPIQIIIKRLDQTIGTSQVSYFCWDQQCLEKGVDQLPLSKKINPQETTLKFESILEAGLVPGISSIKYLIYNRDNPAESLVYEVQYTIEEKDVSKSLFSSSKIRLNDIYPNPVTEFAIIDYQLINENTKAKIVLHNVLGSVVGEYPLTPFENKIKIVTDDFNPGVYFYTLNIDGDGVITQKLIIRK